MNETKLRQEVKRKKKESWRDVDGTMVNKLNMVVMVNKYTGTHTHTHKSAIAVLLNWYGF